MILLGAGGHAKSVVRAYGGEITAYVAHETADWVKARFFYPRELEAFSSHRGVPFLMGIGGVTPGQLEKRLALFRRQPAIGASAIDPYATVYGTVEAGAVVLARAVVQSHARIGEAAIINTGAIVEHDAMIGAGAHIAPGAIILGGAVVPECGMVGAGAVVLPGKTAPMMVRALERC